MIFNYNKYSINPNKLIHLSGLKRGSILDFGCGKGVLESKKIDFKNINKIVLYDKKKKLIKFLTKKYEKKKFKIYFSLKSILKKERCNIVFFSSVVQYISKAKLKKLVQQLSKNKHIDSIIFSDVPYLPRIFEFVFLPLINLNRFIFVLKILFSKKYIKLNYYKYSKKDFNIFKKDFDVKFYKNLHDLKLMRYSVVLKKN